MDHVTRDALRRHYDGTDTSADLEQAELDTSVVAQPMVGITVRLPTATLDAARALAVAQGVKVTTLLREWIEQCVAERADGTRVVSVADLKSLIAQSRFPTTFGPGITAEEVDLDREDVAFRGERLTEARAEAIAQEVLGRAHRHDAGKGEAPSDSPR